VAVTDYYGKIKYINKAARKMLKVGKINDLSEIDVKTYYSPESWHLLQHEMIPKAIKTGSATGELMLISKTGEEIKVSQVLICKKNENGRVEFFASISRDISALIAKEEMVIRQQAYIRNILDANPNPIFVKDKEGIYHFVNKKYCELILKKAEDIIGKSDIKVHGNNKTTQRYRKEDLKVINENATLVVKEESFFDLNEKKHRWFQTIKTPIKSIDGKDTLVLGVASDITSLKEAENVLKRQLRLNEILSHISSEFLNSHYSDINKVMLNALKTICRNTTMTRATINVAGIDKKIKYLHEYSLHKNDPLLKGHYILENMKVEDFSWISEQLNKKGYAYSGDMKNLPDHSAEKQTLKKSSIKSFLIIKLNIKHYHEGYLILSSFNEVNVPQSDFAFIKTVSQLLSTAIERAHTEKIMHQKFQMEEIITHISSHFINTEAKKISEEIDRALKTTATHLGADQVYLFKLDSQTKSLVLSNTWIQSRIPPEKPLIHITLSEYSQMLDIIKNNEILKIPDINSVPQNSHKVKKILQSEGIKSLLGIPLFSKGKFSGTIIFASSENEYFWQEDIIPLLKILGQVLANTLERKKNEEKLRESEHLYRTLAGNLPRSAVLLFNKDLKLTVVEGKIFDDWGYNKTLLEGKLVSEIYDLSQFNQRTDIGEYKTLYKRVLQGESFQIERTYDDKTYQIHIFPIRNEEGEIVSGMLISFDITEFKEIQKKLEQRTQELQSSNEDLEQFAYAASHDLQEPLRMVASYVHLIERKLGDNLSPDIKEFIFYATDGVRRMQQLINDLLEYSRVERKGKRFTEVDMNRVLQAVKFNLHKTITEHQVIIQHPERLPTVKGDYTQIVSVLQNLLDNAIKFKNEQPPLIEINYTAHDDYYTFYVKDNGIGIDPKYFERIFVIFQRLNTRSQFPGTGIGLAICKKIIERHGGTIRVESTPGKGSTFFFDLKKA
jgi:PAS domain S-box-containing protein